MSLLNLLPIPSLTPERIRTILFTIAIVGITATIGFLSHNATELRKERDAAVMASGAKDEALRQSASANSSLENTIIQMTEKAKEDFEVQQQILAALAVIDNSFRETSTRLQTLEKENAQVRAYLDSPVPPELRKLYQPNTAAVGDRIQDAQKPAAAKPNAGNTKPAGKAN